MIVVYILAGILLSYLLVYTILVTPKRFVQCLDAPVHLYQRDPQQGTGASLPQALPGNSIELLINGDEILPAMLDIINSAQTSIRWHVMLFLPDEAGQVLVEALTAAANRGVDVQLAFDINQSMNATFFAPYPPEKKQLFNEAMPVMLDQMQSAGITILQSDHQIDYPLDDVSDEARQLQIRIQSAACIRWDHVDHRKILIVDDNVAIVGGMNVGNEYLYHIPPNLEMDVMCEVEMRQEAGQPEAWEKWQDTAVLVKGPIVRELSHTFNLRWEILGGSPIEVTTNPPQLAGDTPIRMLNQSPGRAEISTGLVELMDNAEDEIYLAYPYVSHPVLLEHLKTASRRGVRVTFIFPGDYNNVAISRRLLRLLSEDLLESGIHLYESNNRMNHTKLMIVDGRHISIGSHNFNYRSVLHDQELNLFIDDQELAQEFIDQVFIPYMQQSDELQEPYELRWNLLDYIILPFS
jgi:cardiolipin synthase